LNSYKYNAELNNFNFNYFNKFMKKYLTGRLMPLRRIARLFLLFAVLTFFSNPGDTSAQPKFEFRGAWLASVANIDWPISNDLSSGQNIADLVRILDQLEAAGINAVLFQVRTECDALYQSNFEPWSYWLTGEQGRAPEPFFDPLSFIIDEAHNRGMELHAWLNPYRAVRIVDLYENSAQHVSNQHPEWLLSFNNYKMLDPGHPGVRDFIRNVTMDIVTRYDIDGIHFDDYFYPYEPLVSNEDSLTFVKFNRGFTDIHDWRRDNINQMVREVQYAIKSVKKHVKFGISPFGIVENKYAGTDGLNSYSTLYCDPLTWIKDKSVDYLNPQIYWEMDHARAAYAKLLPWWASINDGLHLYIGIYSSRFTSTRYKGRAGETGDQVRLNRNTENVSGEVFFSAKSIFNNFSALADSMQNDWYNFPAFTPPMKYLDNLPPLPPAECTAVLKNDSLRLGWKNPGVASDGDSPAKYIIYRFEGDDKPDFSDPANIIKILGNSTLSITFTGEDFVNDKFIYIISSMDRLNNESEPINFIQTE